MKIALLDDWQNNAHTFAEFDRLKSDHHLDVFTDTVEFAGFIDRISELLDEINAHFNTDKVVRQCTE